MKIAALTDIGSCRQENQDNYCARQLVDGTGSVFYKHPTRRKNKSAE